MRTKLFTFLFLGLLSIQLRSQVTIGSGLEPQKGNLLELKENDNTGNTANASKGLGLPRVELKGIDTLTIDMDTEKDKYIEQLFTTHREQVAWILLLIIGMAQLG